ncbi:hypothetical protein SADUNF_Sadunf18G0092600 [Salix dunnii]|uniref:Uncharacterized protein n=1 Tax=Salix dunnii TaxID=1413687 RepID=A0A835J4A0_9ROSI|nr:hypothetical protein SADUNF_Sadunf18G0092600 [Salix dunnii]
MSNKARVIARVLLWAACSALLVQSGLAQLPPLPQIPGLPRIPLPPIPGLPLIPGLPQIPGLPRIQLPPIPGLPRIPGLPQIPGLPRIPLPQIPGLPLIPGLPQIPGLPLLPPLPQIPGLPSLPAFAQTLEEIMLCHLHFVFKFSAALQLHLQVHTCLLRALLGRRSNFDTNHVEQSSSNCSCLAMGSMQRPAGPIRISAAATIAPDPRSAQNPTTPDSRPTFTSRFAPDPRSAQNPTTPDSRPTFTSRFAPDPRPAQNPTTPYSRPSFNSRFAQNPATPDSRPSFNSRFAADSGAAFTSDPWTAGTSKSAPGTGSASTTPYPRQVFTSTTPNSRRSSSCTSSGDKQCWTSVANAAGCVVDITPLLHRQLSTAGSACG